MHVLSLMIAMLLYVHFVIVSHILHILFAIYEILVNSVCTSDARFRVHLDSGSDSDSRKIQKSDSGSDSDSSKKSTDSIPIPALKPGFRFRFKKSKIL